MKLHHPVGYAIADHAAKIFKTDEFKRAAKNAGLRAEDFQNHVVAELSSNGLLPHNGLRNSPRTSGRSKSTQWRPRPKS